MYQFMNLLQWVITRLQGVDVCDLCSATFSVPSLLEYESIPGVSSSKPFGRMNMRQRAKSKSEDVTVKTITKKVR